MHEITSTLAQDSVYFGTRLRLLYNKPEVGSSERSEYHNDARILALLYNKVLKTKEK